MSIEKIDGYSVGALLYCPALNTSLTQNLLQNHFPTPFSLAICLEDTIAENAVQKAEKTLVRTLSELWKNRKRTDFYLPKIFIRVRNAQQIRRLYPMLQPYEEILTGWIFPKYSVRNAEEYNSEFFKMQKSAKKKFYIMPILESGDIVDYFYRKSTLFELKKKIDYMKDYILNVRVGGNDFCNYFGFRRNASQSIYDIKVIANILADIVNVFAKDYVISGPVWEYFQGKDWEEGLKREIALDFLNGFFGKTVIHPNQIPVLNDAMKVSLQDYLDAKEILKWDSKNGTLVSSGNTGERMNEVKTHGRWAEKILLCAKNYGVKADLILSCREETENGIQSSTARAGCNEGWK